MCFCTRFFVQIQLLLVVSNAADCDGIITFGEGEGAAILGSVAVFKCELDLFSTIVVFVDFVFTCEGLFETENLGCDGYIAALEGVCNTGAEELAACISAGKLLGAGNKRKYHNNNECERKNSFHCLHNKITS